jgi:hypothetical protein
MLAYQAAALDTYPESLAWVIMGERFPKAVK